MTNKEIAYKDANISYTISGSGHAVMLIHGFGEDSQVWDAIAVQLSGHYSVLVPDLPGSGKSSLISEEGTGLEEYAECIRLLLAKENIDRCCLVGHSMGGYVSLAFAGQYPEMLSGLALFHSSAFADDAAKVETRKKAIEFIRGKGSAAFLKTSTPGLFADPGQHQGEVDGLIEQGSHFQPQALIQYYEAMISRTDRTAVLSAMEVPVLFILGQHDKAIPIDQGLRQSHLPSTSHLTVLRESGHMGMFEEPEKAFNTLADFLHSVYV